MSILPDDTGLWTRLKHLVVGRPHDLGDRRVLHHMALIPLLAWIGLGADGLSSSAYGPEECMKALGQHKYLAIPLGLMTAMTVWVISSCFSRIIEQFPQGGGGYVVTTALLGKHAGVVAGCALVIDYVLTISVSVAAAVDALFSLIDPSLQAWKLTCCVALIFGLVLINIRGVKESVLVLTPIFMLFVLTHLLAIVGGIVGQAPHIPQTARECTAGFQSGLATLGILGMLKLFFHAYSLGGGTYTGIEAVSNGLGILREPKVQNGKRTMFYMAFSLAFTAAGLLVCYLLWNISPQEGKTLNAVLLERLADRWPGGGTFVFLALLSEAALLIVAAQAGFIGGPRVLSNMALDSWVPHRFSALSERLTTQNGILLMGVAALATLFYSRGSLSVLIVMYSINVFITFTLAIFGMLQGAMNRPRVKGQSRHIGLFLFGFMLCGLILTVTVVDKFGAGGWVTLVVTGAAVLVCFWIRSHYHGVYAKLEELRRLADKTMPMRDVMKIPAIDPMQPTAGLLVGGYNGTGIHTMANIVRAFPGHYKNFVFISAGVVDSGEFKGEFRVEQLKQRTGEMLQQYVKLAHSYGLAATSRHDVGTDVVDAAADLCRDVAKEFPRVTFFTGNVIFPRSTWVEMMLHNQTAFAIQRRLHWDGLLMVIMPMRMR